MELTFIGQGLDPDSERTSGKFINDSLENGTYDSFNAFVAFVSTGGVKNIIEKLVEFKKNGGNVRLYVGVDLNGTSKEALEFLINQKIETYIVYSPNNITYHPKIYTFTGKKLSRAIIGSSNLTTSGLFQNVEASVCIDFENEDDVGNGFISDIYDHFNSIISGTHSSCSYLTDELLQILLENCVVLSEEKIRAQKNKIAKEFSSKSIKSNTELLAMFGKLKTRRPPKGFKKIVEKLEIFENEPGYIEVTEQTVELPSGAMWIETGKMTGGSRNILDLSKKGKLKGKTKFGSVSFFGIDPENHDDFIDIDLIYCEKKYENNHIFYAHANSNWRIRLNGITVDKEKLTAISKPSLGNNGGFQDKILVFTTIDQNTYHLDILEKEYLAYLIENSSEWAMGGNETTGRSYGVIK